MTASPSPSAHAAVIAANETFYRAFTRGDFAAMRGLWAERAPVMCFHPGAPVLLGRDAVLGAWKQILSGPSSFVLRCDQPRVHLLGETAIVTCYEAGDEEPAHLAATNVFVLEDGAWRMIHHHAGPLSRPVPRGRAASELN